MFDLCVVIRRSDSQVATFIEMLKKNYYDLKKINLYFVVALTQHSIVDDLKLLKKVHQKIFGHFEVIPIKEDRNFAGLYNIAAKAGKSEFLFFSCVDIRIFPDAFLNLEKAVIKSNQEYAVFELRRYPKEQLRYYDPVTLELSWADITCMVIRRKVFEEIGGFDETFSQYGMSIDFSWHTRSMGYRIRYVPSACVTIKGSVEENVRAEERLAGEWILHCKYSSPKELRKWEQEMKAVRENYAIDQNDYNKQLFQQIQKCRKQYRLFWKKIVNSKKNSLLFFDFQYGFLRSGTNEISNALNSSIRFTIVIRTFQRPQLLARTLESLRWQVYTNFDVIVVEDGKNPVSMKIVESAAQWLNICYVCARTQWGRCRTGNEGVIRAQTEYVCFLDDDDYFFADHLETMARLISRAPECGMFCAQAVEGRCRISSCLLEQSEIVSIKNVGKTSLGSIDFFIDNPVPIQAVVFRKELYMSCGGLDPELDALEDWDLWMRMACKTQIASVEKATSIFRVPEDPKEFEKRHANIDRYREKVYHKMASYERLFTAQQVYGLYWKPQQSQDIALQNKEWRKKAEELSCTLVGKIMAPFRKLFNRIEKMGHKIFGPNEIDFEQATTDELRRYCMIFEDSWLWGIFRRLCRYIRMK